MLLKETLNLNQFFFNFALTIDISVVRANTFQNKIGNTIGFKLSPKGKYNFILNTQSTQVRVRTLIDMSLPNTLCLARNELEPSVTQARPWESSELRGFYIFGIRFWRMSLVYFPSHPVSFQPKFQRLELFLASIFNQI